jgi:hypothetical protein
VTAIAGLAYGGAVYMGGDSAGVAGLDMRVRADTKVFRNGPYLFGFTDSFRMGQLLHHALKPPAPVGEPNRFMATTFIDAVRDCLKEGGWSRKDSDREEGGTFLVGLAGRLFCVYSDYQIGEDVDGYMAVGCGAQAALGSLHATAVLRVAPKRRVLMALEAAERLSAGVRAPFHTLTLGTPRKKAPTTARSR